MRKGLLIGLATFLTGTGLIVTGCKTYKEVCGTETKPSLIEKMAEKLNDYDPYAIPNTKDNKRYLSTIDSSYREIMAKTIYSGITLPAGFILAGISTVAFGYAFDTRYKRQESPVTA